MKLEDEGYPVPLEDELERIFKEKYLDGFMTCPPFVRLESEGFLKQPATFYADPAIPVP